MSEFDVTALNGTLIRGDDCTLEICSLEYATIQYQPNLAGNILFIAIFALCLVVQIPLGWRYRTWGFFVAMFGGLILEIVGYVGRVQMHYDPFNFNNFIMYVTPLTIGPAFLSAGIYLCLARVINIYGEHISRLRPRTYTIVFITCDFISLLLQAVGGAVTSVADDNDRATIDAGINTMIAGLASQVISMFAFIVLCIDFAWAVKKTPESNRREEVGFSVRSSKLWKAFLASISLATILIFIRCIFRVAELSEGFDSALANDEITFMLLEGTAVSVACILMTATHPGVCFQGQWASYNFTFRTQKNKEAPAEFK